MEYKAFIVTPHVKRTQTLPPGVPPLAQKGSLIC